MSEGRGARERQETGDRPPPTAYGLGQAPRQRHWHPSPRKAPQEKSRQVSWLAAHPYSLRLPKGSPLSGLCRFRSAHSDGAALALHQLPCSQRPAVRHPGFLRPVNEWFTLPPSPVPYKINFAVGAVRVVHTPSRPSLAPEAPVYQAGSVSLCRPVVLVFGTDKFMSIYVLYCASKHRRYLVWPVYGVSMLRPVGRSFWI